MRPRHAWDTPPPRHAGVPEVKPVKLHPPPAGRVSGSRARDDPPSRDRDPDDEEGAVLEFFGQLWFIPETPPPQPRVRFGKGGVARDDLVWIEKKLWERNSFTPEDCFPVGDADVWSKSPAKLSFAERIWGRGEKRSFVQVIKSMAGRGRGGRPRDREGVWEDWHGVPPPHPYPPPSGPGFY